MQGLTYMVFMGGGGGGDRACVLPAGDLLVY